MISAIFVQEEQPSKCNMCFVLEDQETELLIKGSKVSLSNQKNRCLANCDTSDNEIKGKNSQVSASLDLSSFCL